MAETSREARLTRAFVLLADTLVADFDLVALLQGLVETCADLLDVTSAGLMLRDAEGELHVVASTTEDAQFVEVVQMGAEAGPCLQCLETGRAVSVPDIEAGEDRWPAFARAARQRGFRSVHATPMRLRDDVIGTVNLFDSKPGALNAEDVAAAQALSDVATIGILSDRAARERSMLNQQLEYALGSRIVIEQAKGVLAQSTGSSMDEAFAQMRFFARRNNRTIRSVAAAVVDRELDPARLQPDRRGAAASPRRPEDRRPR